MKDITKNSPLFWGNEGWFQRSFGFCADEKAWNKHVKLIGHPYEPYPVTRGMTTIFHNTKIADFNVVVTIAEFMDRETVWQIAGILAHEASHVLEAITIQMQEQDKLGDEVRAHSMQAITAFLMDAYVESRQRPVKWKMK